MKAKLLSVLLFVFFISNVGIAANKNNCNPPPPKQLARSEAFLQNTPCAPVMSACNAGQYYLNCHRINGKGLIIDCKDNLQKGIAVPGVTMQPNDPAVAACKAYCHQNKGACNEENGVSDR